MSTLTMGELFAGIGGLIVGFHRAGFETRWAVEWDRDCQRVLRHHWPELEIHGDICAVDPARLEYVDVITFGSPCQDLSVAGRRAGLAGERSGLFYEACRIIDGVRPEFAVWENVPGAFSSNRGRDFGAVLDALADLGALDIGWRVLDAQWFGVAQRRRRVFVVADFRGKRAGEILALADGLSGHPAPRRDTGAGVAHSSRASTGSRGTDDPDRLTYVAIQDAAMPRAKKQNGIGIAYDAPMYTLDSHGAHAVAATVSSKWARGTGGPAGDEVQNLVAHTLSANGADASEDGTGRGTPLVLDLAQVTSPGSYSNPRAGDPCHPLTSAAGQSVVAFNWQSGGDQRLGLSPELVTALGTSQTPAVAFTQNQRNEVRDLGSLAGALSSQPGMKQQNYLAFPMAVRRLTPRECERLQGFPDVRKTVTIRPCLNCSDHPKTSAIVDSQSHRSLRRASHVAVTVLTEHVPFAERHTAPKHPSDNRPVALSVRIDCERNEVELHSHGRLLWSASGADSQSSYRLPMPVKDFVRLAVRTISTAEQTIQDGRAASPSGNGHSTLLPSGALCVPLCGRENDEPVSDAVVSTTAQGHRSTSITLPATTSSPTSDSTLATLLCSAASAISSCIPDETQDENSSGFSITTTNGWTLVDGMADSPRYRMLGNAVAVPVVEWIGRRIAEVLR